MRGHSTLQKILMCSSCDKMKVSIGICAYNEEKNIARLLDNLITKQDLPPDSEIMVVCSGCTDSTPKIVNRFCEKDRRVKLIIEPARQGKAHAFNKILDLYQGDILVNVDADHVPLPKAIPCLLRHFNDWTIGAVSGCRVPVTGSSFMNKVNLAIWSLHKATQQYYDQRGGAHLGGVLYAVRRGICTKMPENIVNDDAFIGVECIRKGYKVHFERRAVVFFQGPENLSEFVTQRRRIVYGHYEVKRETGLKPRVLEMAPLKDKVEIVCAWLRESPSLIPHFIVACFLELCAYFLAILDILKKNNPHIVWKVALTGKNPQFQLKDAHGTEGSSK